MSRFFTDLEEEKKEYKKKFVAPQKTVEKLSKKDKLMNELETRIKDIEKNPKNIKKFLSDLKKYEVLGLPDFLKNFLLSDKVYFKNNKKVIDEYIKNNINENINSIKEEVENKNSIKEEDENNINENEGDENKNNKDLDEEDLYEKLLKIKDKNIRIEKMKDLLKKINDENIRVLILLHLLSVYTKDKNINELYDTFINILSFYENQKAKNIINTNLEYYLDIIKNNKKYYKSALEKIKLINHNIYERRYLEIEYINKNYIETSQIDFKLIKLMNENKLKESMEILKEINYKKMYDDIFINNIYEYSKYLFRNKIYKEVFICYLYIYTNKPEYKNIKRDLYILCIILNKNIIRETFFVNFLNDFKRFGSNTFALKSHDEIFEIFRAFYLLHELDIEGCYEIINKILPDFSDKEVLEMSILNF